MRRTILGILALVSVIGGLLTLLLGPPGETYLMIGASGLRIGLVLGAFWLAYPQLSRIPWWFVQAMLAAALVIAIRPKVAFLVLPLLLVLWIVRPRKGKGKATKPVAKRAKSGSRRS